MIGLGNHGAAHELPEFRLPLGLKNASLVLDTAASSSVPMPLGSLLLDRYLAAIAHGRENLDWGGIALNVFADAGLPTKTPS